MLITSIIIVLMMSGFICMYLAEILPLFSLMQFEWVGGMLIAAGVIAALLVLSTSKAYKLFEKPPLGKYITLFLRRDGTVEPCYATRPFHGESFLDIPKVGIVHDLGEGTVYRWGNKNIRFALENVNHTPDPTYANYTSWIHNLGFDNMSKVMKAIEGGQGYNIIENIPDVDPHVDIDRII